MAVRLEKEPLEAVLLSDHWQQLLELVMLEPVVEVERPMAEEVRTRSGHNLNLSSHWHRTHLYQRPEAAEVLWKERRH